MLLLHIYLSSSAFRTFVVFVPVHRRIAGFCCAFLASCHSRYQHVAHMQASQRLNVQGRAPVKLPRPCTAKRGAVPVPPRQRVAAAVAAPARDTDRYDGSSSEMSTILHTHVKQ